MQERLKAIWNRIKEFWLKFNKTQRILFIVITVVTIAAIIIVAAVVNHEDRVIIRSCQSAAEATEVRALLQDNGIANVTIDKNNVVYVNDSDSNEARLILGSNNISSDGFKLTDAVTGSMSYTATDKERLYKAYLESRFEGILESMDGIKKAKVTINFVDAGATIFTENENASITAMLTLTKELSYEQAESIGLMLATNVGSDNTNNVVVLDSRSQTLYYGGTSSITNSLTANQKVTQTYENAIVAKAKQLFISTGWYTDVTVTPNLIFDFDDVEIVEHHYTAPEGTESGLPKTSYVINSEGSFTNAGGAAGTESNDQDTDYLIQTNDGQTSSYSLSQYEWLQDEVITTTKPAKGEYKAADSSLAIVAIRKIALTEDDAKKRGLLDDTTWEQFKVDNDDPVETDLDDRFYDMVAKATGIDRRDITIISYDRYDFYEEPIAKSSPMFIIQIILAALIAAILLFIIIRSARPVAVAETEPELSVEDMLATTKENRTPLEDIDLQDKSETRIAIEKFVDENPEAVASLLRNWLNEGWQ